MKNNEFTITQQATAWHFLPSVARTRKMIALLVLSGIFVLPAGLVMNYFHWTKAAPHFFTVGGSGIALLLWSTAIWTWHSRNTSLIIETATGAVSYGKKVLCEGGTVKAVSLQCATLDVQERTCHFEFVVGGGPSRSVPSPLFANLSVDVASEMAETIANLLNVGVLT